MIAGQCGCCVSTESLLLDGNFVAWILFGTFQLMLEWCHKPCCLQAWFSFPEELCNHLWISPLLILQLIKQLEDGWPEDFCPEEYLQLCPGWLNSRHHNHISFAKGMTSTTEVYLLLWDGISQKILFPFKLVISTRSRKFTSDLTLYVWRECCPLECRALTCNLKLSRSPK